jgi:WD40 repeat protein
MAFSDGIVGLCDHRQVGDITEIKAHASWINSVEFGVTDTYLGSAGIDRSIKIYDLRNIGEPVFSEKNLDSSLKKILFANDNTVFGIGSDGGITQWNIPEQAVYSNLAVKKCGIVACDIFVENRWLVFSGEDAVLSILSY